MGIDTGYELKKQPFNISWKRFSELRNVTVSKNRIFQEQTKFFTIGSCFANELRDALERSGADAYPKPSPHIFDCFPTELKRPSSWGAWDDRVHLQFYNTASLRQEFEKAFGLWTQPDDDYFVVEQGGITQYWDPYRRSIYADSPENLAKIRRAEDEAMQSGIMHSDVAVITLGLIEVFRRTSNKLVTCQYNRHFVKHVQFEVLDFLQNYQNVRAICELYLHEFPQKHIILTVSPIALTQTFRELDVVVANVESKSILRAVAGQITQEFPNAIYWPSYEICNYNEGSFKSDLRHVTRERVDSIMNAFRHCFMHTDRSAEEEEQRYF
jgi:hypothetical protein